MLCAPPFAQSLSPGKRYCMGIISRNVCFFLRSKSRKWHRKLRPCHIDSLAMTAACFRMQAPGPIKVIVPNKHVTGSLYKNNLCNVQTAKGAHGTVWDRENTIVPSFDHDNKWSHGCSLGREDHDTKVLLTPRRYSTLTAIGRAARSSRLFPRFISLRVLPRTPPKKNT